MAELAQRAQRGEAAAFDSLVGIFWDGIARMVYCRTYSLADSEDLTQDVFLTAYDRIKSLQDPAKFKAWLYRIALNRVRDFHRKESLRRFWVVSKPEPEMASPASAFQDAAKGQFWAEVREFCQGLPAKQRQAFQLRYLDQLSIDEICQATGSSPSAIKTHLGRAVAKLRNNSKLLARLRGES